MKGFVAAMSKSPSAKPRIRNARQTQDKILAAAHAEFARKGYEGARVDAIANRAKVSKNLLYHYFRSKEELYIRALERTYATLRRRQNEVSLVGLDPIEAMRLLCESTFQTFIDDPTVISMLNTENLHRGKYITKSHTIFPLYNDLGVLLNNILQQGVKRGVFRDDIDPTDLYISISSLGYFYLSNRYTLSLLFDRDLMQPDILERRKAHIVDVILSYLTFGLTDAAPTSRSALQAGEKSQS